MWDIIRWFANMTERTYNTVNSWTFDIGGVMVGYADIFIGAIAVCMVVALFWKGARG